MSVIKGIAAAGLAGAGLLWGAGESRTTLLASQQGGVAAPAGPLTNGVSGKTATIERLTLS